MKFNIGHFPVGTIVQIQVFDHQPMIETEVTGLVCNGPNSWCITTTAPGETTEFYSCNIDHVKTIVKRGDGPMVFERNRSVDWKRKHFESVGGNTKKVFGVQKHPSQFIGIMNVNELVYNIAMDYVKPDMLFNNDKLVRLLIAGGHFVTKKLSNDGDDYSWNCLQINKKRLKNAIKRVINKAYVNRKKAQKEQNDIDYQDYLKDMDREREYNQDPAEDSCYSSDEEY